MKMRKNCLSPGELGHGFEEKVKQVFESNGYIPVKKNQWKTNYALEKDKARKREYDLVMFKDRNFYIIECKAHYREDKYVGVRQVMEFNHKLANYNGLSAIRMMVSDTDFTYNARRYASNNKIRLVNGPELKRMESKGRFGLAIAGRVISGGLEGLLKGVMKNYSR